RMREKLVFPDPFAPYITARFVLPNARDAPALIALTPETPEILLIRSSGRWAAWAKAPGIILEKPSFTPDASLKHSLARSAISSSLGFLFESISKRAADCSHFGRSLIQASKPSGSCD